MKSTQKGFSAVEAVLIIVIVGIIGFAGWFVWNSQKQTNETLDNTGKASNAVITTEKATDATGDSSTTQGAVKYVDINEWGVKIPLAENIKAVSYTYDTSKSIFPGAAIIVTAITDSSGNQFKPYVSTTTNGESDQSVDAICITYGLGRSTNSSETNLTTGSLYDQVAHIGSYYYYNVNASGAACGQSTAATKATDATKEMFKSLVTE